MALDIHFGCILLSLGFIFIDNSIFRDDITVQMQEFIVPLILSANTATVFCGDLNEGPEEAGVSYLGNYLQDSFGANTSSWTTTFPADHPSARMDYIFFNQACAAVDYQIIPSLASDHLPIMAVIDF